MYISFSLGLISSATERKRLVEYRLYFYPAYFIYMDFGHWILFRLKCRSTHVFFPDCAQRCGIFLVVSWFVPGSGVSQNVYQEDNMFRKRGRLPSRRAIFAGGKGILFSFPNCVSWILGSALSVKWPRYLNFHPSPLSL